MDDRVHSIACQIRLNSDAKSLLLLVSVAVGETAIEEPRAFTGACEVQATSPMNKRLAKESKERLIIGMLLASARGHKRHHANPHQQTQRSPKVVHPLENL
jgi:hypothetical protein